MPLTTLFLDLNSYFASVEQQVDPSLRNRPMAVAPITGDGGCCIAASYEAKAFGVKTGTRVGDAKRLCPGIAIADARPRLYVLMHHRILKAVDKHLPVHKVHSIDELSCRLDPRQRSREAAEKLAKEIKATIRADCGVCMRCSIGVAPNRVLAKLGTDMMKPDGLVILDDADIPGKIAHLSAQELSGIGPKMMKRLERRGIRTIGDLWERREEEMEHLWGGIVGIRWHHWLKGHEVAEKPTHKNSIGHQHVLGPDRRTREGARAVLFRLTLKAAARMRYDGYAARRLTVGARYIGDAPSTNAWGGPSWDQTVALGEGCTDTPTMLDAVTAIWENSPVRTPLLVSVTLHELVPAASQTLPLFQTEAKRADLSKAMDLVNKKFGANTVYTANIHNARRAGSGGIAFNYVPNLAVTDSVQSRQRGEGPYLTDEQLEALIERSLEA